MSLASQVLEGDRRALARLLTLVGRGEHLAEIAAWIDAHRPTTEPPVYAITGSAGVGKSSFIGRLLARIRADELSVAVLACDPESPVSGGALLGDAFRMNAAPDARLFIRSLATPGGHGAIAEHVPLMLQLLAGFGFEVLLVETVGAGQGDTTVRQLADAVVLLVQPHAGDELQWEKAGLLEVADLIVVHKADLPGADETIAQLRSMLTLTDGATPPIVAASSTSGRGIDEVWRTLQTLPRRRQERRANLDEAVHREVDRLLARRRAEPTDAWRQLVAQGGPAKDALRVLLDD
jgi:LAO/AO transport system kinase